MITINHDILPKVKKRSTRSNVNIELYDHAESLYNEFNKKI